MTKHIAEYLSLATSGEKNLMEAFLSIKAQHSFEPDVVEMCDKFSTWSEHHLKALENLTDQYGKQTNDEPGEITDALLSKPKMGSFGLLRDLHSLSTLVHHTEMSWIVLLQAARALRDVQMEAVCVECGAELKKQTMWLQTKIKNAAPQVPVVG
jgi:hypothetical protein